MITKNFIKQCEQAEEIQKAWKPKTRDLIQRKQTVLKNKQIYLIMNIDREIVFYINIKDGEESWCYKDNFKDEFLYLSTQEQLQEMMITKEKKWYKVFSDFFKYINEECHPSVEDFDNEDYSITYFWLAFVMKEKYHKKWLTKEEKWGRE